MCVCGRREKRFGKDLYPHTHAHIFIYIYICVYIGKGRTAARDNNKNWSGVYFCCLIGFALSTRHALVYGEDGGRVVPEAKETATERGR